MDTLEQIILLLISGQGILLSFALLASYFRKKYAAFFFGIVVFVITLEILTNWAISINYTNEQNAIPFWTLGSYLFMAPALWFFLKSTSDVRFQFSKRSILFFIPAFIEVIIETANWHLYTKRDKMNTHLKLNIITKLKLQQFRHMN